MIVNPNVIKRLEIEYNLSDQLICGSHFWDFCRYQFYLEANKKLTGEPRKKKKLAMIYVIFRSFLFLLNLKKGEDFLVVQHPRQQKLNGSPVDLYTDRIVRDLKKVGLSVSVMTRYTHHSALFKETSRANLAALEATSRIASRLFYFFVPMSALPKALEKCNSELGFQFFETRKVRSQVLYFLLLRKLYLIILKWKRPQNVMLVVSAGHESLISACSKLSIPTFEVQHGSPGLGKLNYDYSNGCSKTYFPDVFLAHGRGFGLEEILPACEIIYIGCPFLDGGTSKPTKAKKDFDFLFMSQPFVDEIIISHARLENNRGKCIGIRIHPNYVDIDNRFREIEAEGVKLIMAKSETLYESFSRTRNVVGCFSTALFEATAFDVGIWIIRSEHAESMSQLIESGRARIWEPGGKITANWKANVSSVEDYFVPYNIGTLLDNLALGERTTRL